MPEPIPVLYLNHTARLGGGEIALLNLLCTLDRTRFAPKVVLASDGPLADRLRAESVETHVWPLAADVAEARKDALGPQSLLHLRQALVCGGYALRLAVWARRRGIRLIHTNSLKADLYGGLAGRLAGIPVVWHIRDGIRDDYLPAPVAALFRTLARHVPQMVLTNSEYTRRCLNLPPRARVTVVHDGCDLPSERAEIPDADAPVVALVGRIAPWKGQHVFLRAAVRVRTRFPSARFWIIGAPLFGEDAYAQSLHALTAELGLTERVTFWGFRDDVPDLMSRAAVLTHASTLGEPFGQVVIEGMAAGRPVVATDGGALPEIIVPGETGLLVPQGDDAALADAVCGLLADPVRAAALGAAGRRHVAARFTTGHMAQGVMAAYACLEVSSEKEKRANKFRALCYQRKDS